ncbi:MAG: hypothetical protein QOI99_1005 [Actinomycetota bacterium]|nr:hypothetical protein [Actinomycetota bacterium]
MRSTPMHRLLVLAVTFVAFAGGLLASSGNSPAAATTGAAGQQVRDERRGLVFDGLRQRAGGPCGNAFEIVESAGTGRTRCSHGPDPAPDGVDIRVHKEFGVPAAGTTAPGTAAPTPAVAAQTGIPCYGTGSDGYRVQLVYVRLAGSADRSATLFPSFATWTANTNTVFRDSAAQTGGVRNIRFVTDSGCNLVIAKAEVSSAAMGNFSTYVSELKALGFNQSNRKYLTWADANTYCGIGEIYIDDKATTTPGLSTSNYNNGHPGVSGAFARTDNGCWGQTYPVEAHELTHVLGGVQTSAPHATSGYHCWDESDRMCYVDAAGVTMTQVCPAANERLLDCNHDDYFNTSPVAGSYLATHWNVANSAFLAPVDPGTTPPPPTTTTTVPPTTTTVPPTTTTTVPTTTTTVPPTTTTVPPTTTTTRPPPTPSAPRNVRASRPFSGRGVQVTWTAPLTGPVTGYNVYRRTGSATAVKVAHLGLVNSWLDTGTVSGTAYTYSVSAENGTREGPRSSETSVIAK